MKWDAELYSQNATFNWDSQSAMLPILSQLNLQETDLVLDLGCGSGQLTIDSILPKAAFVLGIDSSPEMIAAAQTLLSSQDASLHNKCQLQVCDGQDLPDLRGIFNRHQDVCFSNAALHWMKKDPDAPLKGVFKALKSGGRFVCEQGGFANGCGIRAGLHRALKTRNLPINDPWYFPTVEEQRQRLDNAGFQVKYIELVPRLTPLANGLRGWLQTFATGSFLEGLSEAQCDEIYSELEELLAVDMKDANGNWTCVYTRLRYVAVKP